MHPFCRSIMDDIHNYELPFQLDVQSSMHRAGQQVCWPLGIKDFEATFFVDWTGTSRWKDGARF